VISGALFLSFWIFSGRIVKNRRDWLNQQWTIVVIVLMLLPWIGLLWAEDPAAGLKLAKKSYYWLYAFAIASLAFSRNSVTTLLGAFIAGLSVLTLFSLIEFAGFGEVVKALPTMYKGTKHIITSLFHVFGMLVLSFYFPRVSGTRRKGLVLFLMAVFFLSLAAGKGRIGYLAFAVLSPLIIYNIFGRIRMATIAAISALIIVALALSPTVRDRAAQAYEDIESYRSLDPNTSIGLRLVMWNAAVKVFLDSPVIGAGTGGYKSAMKNYEHKNLHPAYRNFSHPHNSFLYMAASYGIVGVAALVWLLALLFRNGWRCRNSALGFSMLAFALVLTTGSLTDTQILNVHTAMLFGLFAGLQGHLGEECTPSL
jgi:O-antigen ligase